MESTNLAVPSGFGPLPGEVLPVPGGPARSFFFFCFFLCSSGLQLFLEVLWMVAKVWREGPGSTKRFVGSYCGFVVRNPETSQHEMKPWESMVGFCVGESNHSVGFLRRCKMNFVHPQYVTCFRE